jgi:hypothetical protein
MALSKDGLAARKEENANKELLSAVNYGLEEAVGHAGGVLSGFSVKFGDTDYLMTIRASVGTKRCVAFVGAPTLRDAFRKAVNLAFCDELRWKADKFGNGRG